MKYPHLPGRVLEEIAVLAGVLMISLLALVPQPTSALGVEVFVVGLVGWLIGDAVQAQWWRLTPAEYRAKTGRWLLAVLRQAATLPFLVAGALLLVGATGAGSAWLVAGHDQLVPGGADQRVGAAGGGASPIDLERECA